jgi:hypothetical protein
MTINQKTPAILFFIRSPLSFRPIEADTPADVTRVGRMGDAKGSRLGRRPRDAVDILRLDRVRLRVRLMRLGLLFLLLVTVPSAAQAPSPSALTPDDYRVDARSIEPLIARNMPTSIGSKAALRHSLRACAPRPSR